MDKIVNISHDELEKAVAKALAEINKRAQEMTAVEYLQTTRQICECNSQFKCNGCPFSALTVEDELTCICGELQVYEPERAVEIVKRWKDERDGQ